MGEFGLMDYIAFSSLLVISMIIGFSFKRQNNSPIEIITAGGKMHSFPVGLSMMASFLSSITLVGHPAEAYQYGSHVWMVGLAALTIVPVVGTFMVPFFRKKNYFSAYEYFGERFSRQLQLLTSTIFTFQMLIYLATVLYAPALAMNQMTGLHTMIVVSIMYAVCIFYTTLGGMKGVVWTDAFQVFVTFASMIFILYEGTVNIGGVKVVWERSEEFNRTTFFNFDFSITERYTFWSSLFGSSSLFIINYGANQFQIQRYLTVKSQKDAIRMLWINGIGWVLTMSICLYSGLLVFATYCYCDPLLNHKISAADQLFPLFIKETLHVPGAQGLFICALFSAGLSTVSTGINSLAAIWFAELDGTKFRKNLSDYQSGILIKILAVVFGMVSYISVFAIPHMGGLTQLSITLSSSVTGALFGVFILGLYFPKTNTYGAITGFLASIAFLSWIVVGNNISNKKGLRVHLPLPSSIKDCRNNTILDENSNATKEDAFVLYRISYTWYGAIAVILTVILGILVSCIFKEDKKEETKKLHHDCDILNQKELKPIIINSGLN